MTPSFLIARYGPEAARVVFFGSIIVAALLIGLTVYMLGRSDGKTGEIVKRREAQIELQAEIKQADQRAADTRVGDAVRMEQQRKELDDAFKAANGPDDRRALRGCVVMRQQGRDTTGIPGCQRFESQP